MDLLRELLLDNDSFRQQLSRPFSETELETIYKSDERMLRSNILNSNNWDYETRANIELQQAIKNQNALIFKREKRSGFFRRAHKTQVLATEIINFLDSFSTIVDIVKSIDQRAGGLAYATLYILLKTGHNKQTHEDLITAGLKEFSTLLHRLEFYRGAHLKMERMMTYISDVYKNIIVFAREASIYYTKSGAGRWWKAGIAQPSKFGVEKQIENVHFAINRVSDEASAIMSKRIETATRYMTYAHNDLLASLRQNLGVDDMVASPREIVDACATIYTPGVFSNVSRRGRIVLLQEANIDLLSSFGLLAPFQSSTQSSLLLLSGINHHSYKGDLCWLSPIAVDLARITSGPLAFYSTQRTGPVGSLSQRETLTSLLYTIIYQLLTWDDDFAREWCGTVERAVGTDAWRMDILTMQKELLLVLLNAWAERGTNNGEDRNGIMPPTTIIIDRPDAFCIKFADGERPEWPIGDALYELVDLLLEVLEEARGVVKVAIVMHSAFSCEDFSQLRCLWERLEKVQPPLLVSKRNWEQGRRSRE